VYGDGKSATPLAFRVNQTPALVTPVKSQPEEFVIEEI
jgi:hypothetical protein